MNGLFPFEVLIIVGGALATAIVLLGGLLAYRHLTKKVGPHQALIKYGRRGTTIVVGGASFVNPLTERYQVFPLELMAFSVVPAHVLYTSQGIAVEVEALAQVKVATEKTEHIRLAAEQFLSKRQEEREHAVRQVIEGHLRHVVGHLTVEDLMKNTHHVCSQVAISVTPDLQKMGITIVSLTLVRVSDQHGYIEHVGCIQQEEARKQVSIATAQAQRDMDMACAEAARIAAQAKSLADQERWEVLTTAQAKQAEYEHRLALTVARLKQQVIDEQTKTQHLERDYQLLVEQTRMDIQHLRVQADLAPSPSWEARPAARQVMELRQHPHEIERCATSALSCHALDVAHNEETQPTQTMA